MKVFIIMCFIVLIATLTNATDKPVQPLNTKTPIFKTYSCPTDNGCSNQKQGIKG